MLKYNFRTMLKREEPKVFHNKKWFMNSHFMFDKKILTKAQLGVISEYPENDEVIKKIYNKIVKEEEANVYDYTENKQPFVPTYMYDNKDYKVLIDPELNLCLRQDYYGYLTRRNCVIYKGSDNMHPAIVMRGDRFVGILLPCRPLDKLGVATEDLIPITERGA